MVNSDERSPTYDIFPLRTGSDRSVSLIIMFLLHNDSAQPIKWSYTVAQMMEKFALVLMRSRLKQI
ncbi:hypothetical protein [[Scytonema hofmanni] UTEX B 1581]|uniref:hypothetical protein n=1 Tax=[Scytonema hofmanni] UTEX B 1581 TaxID=379535 RepID=UPI001181E470|nr:hypothetical protein [[Scytonema hofmanni] UTEX B 1581]